MKNGIDISYANGVVDFNAVKNDGVEFIIARAGYGRTAVNQTDRQFERNYTEAKRVGIPLGIYWYSYADSVEDAYREAEACLEVIGDKRFELPVFYDIEESSQLNRGADFVKSIAKAWCDCMEQHGYFAGVYSSAWVWNDLLGAKFAERYCSWVADWRGSCGVPWSVGFWQKSEKGAVIGIIGNVDTDEMYNDYPSIIINGGFNNYPKKQDSSSVSENDSSGSVTVEKPVESVEPVVVEPDQKPVKKPDTVNYTIQPGDTLWGISRKYHTTVKKLKELNPQIENVNLIYAGDVINVPNRGGSEND